MILSELSYTMLQIFMKGELAVYISRHFQLKEERASLSDRSEAKVARSWGQKEERGLKVTSMLTLLVVIAVGVRIRSNVIYGSKSKRLYKCCQLTEAHIIWEEQSKMIETLRDSPIRLRDCLSARIIEEPRRGGGEKQERFLTIKIWYSLLVYFC